MTGIVWNDLPLPVSAQLERTLITHYSETERAYHTLEHIAEMLGHYREVAGGIGWSAPREALAALLYHDIIYVPGAGDNEAQSAALARVEIPKQWPDLAIDIAAVERLILLTAAHGKSAGAGLSADEALFLDCDMAILAAPPARFDLYEAQIAQEFRKIPKLLFKTGRTRFLKRVLASRRIFLSDFFHARDEGAARANLTRTLER